MTDLFSGPLKTVPKESRYYCGFPDAPGRVVDPFIAQSYVYSPLSYPSRRRDQNNREVYGNISVTWFQTRCASCLPLSGVVFENENALFTLNLITPHHFKHFHCFFPSCLSRSMFNPFLHGITDITGFRLSEHQNNHRVFCWPGFFGEQAHYLPP